MTRLLGLTVLLLALCCDSAFAQVTLELTYPPGSKLTSDLALKSHQILTLAGMDLVTKSTTFNIVTKTIGQRGDDGLLAVEEKVDVLQTEVEFPGGIKLVFDSGNPDKKADLPQLEPILERLRAAYKHPVTTILDNTNKIKEIKFPEGVSESVGEANKSLFDAAKRKVTAEQARGFLPDEPVKPGATWERSTDVDFGGGQSMAFRTRYTYDGPIEQDGEKLEKITAKTFEVSYSVDQAAAIRVSKSDLKVTESDETILFDRERGRVQKKTAKLRIQGPLTLVINGTEVEGKVDLTIDETTKYQK